MCYHAIDDVQDTWAGLLITGKTILLSQYYTSKVKSNSSNPLNINNHQQVSHSSKSCYDLKQLGIKIDGIYSIKPENDFMQFATFCDMQTDGGGWTLVASVHESDITQKCDAKDRWTNYVPEKYIASTEKTNWENKKVFGDVSKCTEGDYKNSAYYSLNANDVMVWHVPSNTPTMSMKEKASFRYRTTNHFLQNNGGNLQKMFEERYPLKVYPGKFKTMWSQRSKLVLKALEKNSAEIRANVPNWYTYNYTGNNVNIIQDSKMYSSYGNRVSFGNSRILQSHLYYNRIYRDETYWEHTIVRMKASQPFILVTAISNENSFSQYFYIKVETQRYKGDFTELIQNTRTNGNFKLQYKAVQFRQRSYATVCEFHFVISNTKDWMSRPPTSFERNNHYSSSTVRRNQFQVDGSPSNIVMGYMLLTRNKGEKITVSQADGVADNIIQAVASIHNLFQESEGLVAPVTFDKGSTNAILKTIPTNFRSTVEAGYLEFRAYNLTGYPNAMCPGIKVKSFHPEFVCLGGISGDIGDDGTCGDFAGWAGKNDDVINRDYASGNSHSQKDISSTILIFYR
uniref:uncharacterized protein LOC120335080 n=1 Tax=Styela clava TaxID=7725 RepID=UPI001939740E|nr:uncharacterized protein LOC120335080 [Styela clava]